MYVAVHTYSYIILCVCWLYDWCVVDTCEFDWQGGALLRDLLAIQTIVELNVAFCEQHLVKCPPSEQLQKECTYVSRTFPC